MDIRTDLGVNVHTAGTVGGMFVVFLWTGMESHILPAGRALYTASVAEPPPGY